MSAPDATTVALLCKAARNRALDTLADVAVFVAGVLSRGPITAEDLVDVLERAGFTPDQVRAAAELAPRARQRAGVTRSSWMRADARSGSTMNSTHNRHPRRVADAHRT